MTRVLLDLKLFYPWRPLLKRWIMSGVIILILILMVRAGESQDLFDSRVTRHLAGGHCPRPCGLWFSAYAESLADDLLELKAAYDMVNTNPLGRGLGTDSSVAWNRQMTTDLLGFFLRSGLLTWFTPQIATRENGEKTCLFSLASRGKPLLGRVSCRRVPFSRVVNFGFVAFAG